MRIKYFHDILKIENKIKIKKKSRHKKGTIFIRLCICKNQETKTLEHKKKRTHTWMKIKYPCIILQ